MYLDLSADVCEDEESQPPRAYCRHAPRGALGGPREDIQHPLRVWLDENFSEPFAMEKRPQPMGLPCGTERSRVLFRDGLPFCFEAVALLCCQGREALEDAERTACCFGEGGGDNTPSDNRSRLCYASAFGSLAWRVTDFDVYA